MAKIVRARRLGWNEVLTPNQSWGHNPYDYEDDDLEGELATWTVPKSRYHPELKIYLVGGQSADPDTIEVISDDEEE